MWIAIRMWNQSFPSKSNFIHTLTIIIMNKVEMAKWYMNSKRLRGKQQQQPLASYLYFNVFWLCITVCVYINEKYENHMKFYELIHLLEHLSISPIYFSVSFTIFSISINAFNMCLSLYEYRSHIWYDRSMDKWMWRCKKTLYG